ncbi:MAG: helix-turn-helix domain-containing protein [Anaerolineae bacterium]
MYRLRQKLEDDTTQPAYIVNMPGVGYRLHSQEQWEEVVRRGQ